MSNYRLTQELIDDGSMALYQDYRSGTLLDWSGNGNSGAASSGCRLIGAGGSIGFSANTDEITVTNSASLGVTNMSLIVLSTGGFQSQVTSEYIVSKRAGAAIHFQFYAIAGSLVFYDGIAARTRSTNILGAKSIGMTYAAAGTAIGYQNGLSIGNFSGASTITTATANLEIGNWANIARCRSSLSAVMLVNKVLTATEMAQLHGELLT